MPDCLCRPTWSTFYRAQVRGLITQLTHGLICPKSGTGGSDAIHLRQELINIISYVKRGEYRAMSECSKYQLLLQTDYVRLKKKNDHLYIYSHYTILHCPQGIISAIFETKDYCPIEWCDGCCKTIAACETMVDRNMTDYNC